MNIFSLTGITLIAIIISQNLKKKLPEYLTVFSVIICALIFLFCLPKFQMILEEIKLIFSRTKLANEYLEIIFKTLGICILTQFASDSCKDSGENALASQIELAGKTMAAIIALPLFRKIFEIILELVKN